MKQLLRVFIVTFFLVVGIGCTNPEKTALMSQSTLVSRLQSESVPLVLDVRSPKEFSKGHVPGAVNIPYDKLAKNLAQLSVNRDDEIVVYCERGGRASIAEKVLRDEGFREVLHLQGDMNKWRENRLPCEGC